MSLRFWLRRPTQSRFITPICWSLAASMVLGGSAMAEPVAVEFLPPELPAQAVCAVRASSAVVLARWADWNGASLKGMDVDAVEADMTRLQDMDAVGNFDTIDAMLDHLPEIAADIDASEIARKRAALYLAAGKIRELTESGLIEKLTADRSNLSPSGLGLLSDIYRRGLGTARDEKLGLQLLVEAAYGGHADSLLQLAEMNLNGQKVEGWTLDPQLGVTMAFGALVGDLDPDICKRIGRIAREYQNGDVVAQNNALASQWLRLAADLGDAAAAWQFAQLHLAGENLEKDNDALITYLKIAADSGEPGAIVELGHVYENGALAPRDMDAALALYRTAAATGYRQAWVRLATMLETNGKAGTDEHIDALTRLYAMDNPPASIYSRLAKAIIERDGRWASEGTVTPILEKGVVAGDPDSHQMLAQILLRHAQDKAQFNRAVDLLNRAVTVAGKIDPMHDLRDAYICRDPNGPNTRLADYWRAGEENAGTATPNMSADRLARLSPTKDPAILAQLQSHALYGRPTAVAYYFYYLQKADMPDKTLDYWRAQIDAKSMLQVAVAREFLEQSENRSEIEGAVVALRAAAETGNPEARFGLASVLLDYFPHDRQKREEAVLNLRAAARAGSGQAMVRMASIVSDTHGSGEGVYRMFEDVIAERGDADALIFAAGFISDETAKREKLAQAASIMGCTFENAMKLARSYQTLEDVPEVEHWLNVGMQLTEGNTWRPVAVADTLRQLGGSERNKRALRLYEEAVAIGSSTAASRLLKVYGSANDPSYSPEKAAKLFVTMLADADVPQIEDTLTRLDKAPYPIRERVLAEISVRDLYRNLADKGDPAAMRQLGIYVRDHGRDVADAHEAADWLSQASDKGDSQAMVELAKAYALGMGIEPSFDKASQLLEKAADQGNDEAIQMLSRMTLGAN